MGRGTLVVIQGDGNDLFTLIEGVVKAKRYDLNGPRNLSTSFLRFALRKRCSRSALIVVACVFSCRPVCLRQVRDGVGRSLIRSPWEVLQRDQTVNPCSEECSFKTLVSKDVGTERSQQKLSATFTCPYIKNVKFGVHHEALCQVHYNYKLRVFNLIKTITKCILL